MHGLVRTRSVDAAYCCTVYCGLRVCVSVCVLGTRVDCAKTAEPIVSRFGGQTVVVEFMNFKIFKIQ